MYVYVYKKKIIIKNVLKTCIFLCFTKNIYQTKTILKIFKILTLREKKHIVYINT